MRKQKSRPSRRIRHKSGSIMIMVVALLVLMALIGTAYIATARIDRSSAVQNADNVQIDILVDAVRTFCKTAVSGDLFDGNGNYRPIPRDPYDSANNTIPNNYLRDSFFYYNITSTLNDAQMAGNKERIDHWLADRTPNFGSTPTNNTNHYYWPRISQPLTTEISGTGPIRGFFEDPTYVPKSGAVGPTNPLILQFRNDGLLEPTSIPIGGVPMPAFKINTGISGLDPYTALAADADGDGIADSFLVRMPIGTINGITYYYAVRIIDNAAAVNINTAWGDNIKMSSGNFDSGLRIFPSSINLDDQFGGSNSLFTRKEVNYIHAYRSGRNFPGNADLQDLGTELTKPRDDYGIVRKDFSFLSEHDAFWMQLGRRPENPGFIPSATGAFRYRSFPLSDLISLVPHFVVAPQNSSSVIDATMSAVGFPNDLSGTNKPYSPGNSFGWGNDNFDYTNTYSRRPLIVTSNAVSTVASPHFMPAGSTDVNNDGIDTNDVPSVNMLDYSVSENGSTANAPPDPRPHKITSWTTGFTYWPHDVLQLTLNNGQVLNFAYARSHPSGTTLGPLALGGADYWEAIPNFPNGSLMKTSLNTASFGELYRSYWNVMCDDKNPNLTPYGDPAIPASPYSIPHPNRQYRSSLRDIHGAFTMPNPPAPGYQGYRFPPFQQLLLRAALAAVNTIDLRDSDDDVTSRTIVLKYIGKDGATHPVEVTLYGYEPQPFITEVYANANTLTDDTGDANGIKNPKGYLAVELFNPHDQDFSLEGWRLGLIDRRRGRTNATGEKEEQFHIRDLNVTFAATDIIKKGQYFVMENFREATDTGSATNAALYRPTQVGNSVGTNRKYVPELGKVFEDKINSPNETGGELVLLRPRRADKSLKKSTRPYDRYDETNNNLLDWVPVDSFDFTGLRIHGKPQTNGNPEVVHVWHYVRINSNNGDSRWKCVYPGRYDGGKGGNGPDPEEPRQDAYDLKLTISDPPTPNFSDTVIPAPNLGGSDSNSSFKTSLTERFPPIQLNNRDFGGPNEIQSNTNNTFPFGGFQRVGDVMQVPFIGAYRVRELDESNGSPIPETSAAKANFGGYKLKASNPANVFLELNTISMDSSFADDADDNDNLYENIGRFCPIPANLGNYFYYDFGRRIFDYFTVIAPNEDYLPNINPDRTPDANKNNTSLYRYFSGQYQNIMGASGNYPNQHADPVKNIDNGSSIPTSEPLTGIHGQININTANWKVLSTIPFTFPPNAVSNANIAKGIVAYREANGPFASLFDLYRVPEFTANQPIGQDPDDDEGDFSPGGPGNKDGVTNQYEFEKEYLLLTRISNLLTTRSDSFTAYIIVQGWRNPNTPQAELVVQRRAAMLIDRAGVTKDNREPRTMLIPVE